MSRRLHDRETPARRAWLEQLDRAPGSIRRHRAGFECMRLGWTQWKAGTGDGASRCGEELTSAGRAMLEQWREDERAAAAPDGLPPVII